MKQLNLIISILAALVVGIPQTGAARNLDLPAVVSLDKLENLYSSVEFDHEYHLDITDDCTYCHHHTVGIPPTSEKCFKCHNSENVLESVACANCHLAEPFSARNIMEKEALRDVYHIDKPGLKAAYHLNCLKCHVEMAGPSDCDGCHERTDPGNAFYRSGSYAPKGAGEASSH